MSKPEKLRDQVRINLFLGCRTAIFAMLKKISLILLVLLTGISSRGHETNIYSMMSPKLRQFLADYPDVSGSLSNVLSEAFSNRTVQLYYFYTDNESVARASHYYQNESSVVIGIQENQRPSDQCICLIFEALNSEGEKRFYELAAEALSGNISRADFARGMMRQEFQAVKKMQKLLQGFKYSKREFGKSDYYEAFIECPDTFEAFLNLVTSAVSVRNELKDYEEEYDALRQTQQRPSAALKPTAATASVSTNK